MAARVGGRLRASALLRAHGHAQAAALRLHHDHPLADAAPAHRRRPADRRHRAAAARRCRHRRAACGCSASASPGCRSTRRATCSPRTTSPRSPRPSWPRTRSARSRRPPSRRPPAEKRWWPGQDVRHEELGAGWVWGRGLGRVTVRFEGPLTAPGPVRTLAADDPALQPRRSARLEAARVTARSWWGWGTTDRALPDDECVALAALLPGLPDRPRPVPRLEDLSLPAPRVAPPAVPARARPTPADRAAPHLRQGLPRRRPRAVRRPRRGARRRRLPAHGGRRRRRARLGGGRRASPSSPTAAGARVVGGVEYRGDRPRRVARPDRRWTACSRSTR